MSNQNGVQQKIQKFGRVMSGMVMPNIGAFIAWGLITAMFIPTGWTPNENLSALVGPMITYLLPMLIGYTGGNTFGGARGGVIGAIATMGVIIGSDIPMFLGAMIMGPLGGAVIRKFDDAIEGKVPSGFEMLVNNFSAGIIGTILALAAYLGIGPVVLALNNVLSAGVNAIVNAGLLPLASMFIEPGKILFLNNAMNHGILGPLGIAESAQTGKSIFFLLETNPGPGLGILLAYMLFGKGTAKQSAPGAVIIHFLGGIHEIYFPYVLMNPVLVLAVIAGGISGVFTFSLLGAGLVATPSPGSIFALIAMTPKGNLLSVLAGVAVSATVSCLVAMVIIKFSAEKNDSLDEAQEATKAMKAQSKGQSEKIAEAAPAEPVALDGKKVDMIVFACDAGMGSSAMGATAFSKKLKAAGKDIPVKYYPVDEVPAGADVVVTNISLTGRARSRRPEAVHVSIKDFFNDPALDQLLEALSGNGNVVEEEMTAAMDVLMLNAVEVGVKSESKEDAIKRAGRRLVELGYADEAYVSGMLKREEVTTTYIGSNVAIPHGTNDTKSHVKQTGLVILQYPDGVDFGDGNVANLVIGIAAIGDEHMMILANIAESIGNEEVLETLKATKDPAVIYNQFSNIG